MRLTTTGVPRNFEQSIVGVLTTGTFRARNARKEFSFLRHMKQSLLRTYQGIGRSSPTMNCTVSRVFPIFTASGNPTI